METELKQVPKVRILPRTVSSVFCWLSLRSVASRLFADEADCVMRSTRHSLGTTGYLPCYSTAVGRLFLGRVQSRVSAQGLQSWPSALCAQLMPMPGGAGRRGRGRARPRQSTPTCGQSSGPAQPGPRTKGVAGRRPEEIWTQQDAAFGRLACHYWPARTVTFREILLHPLP